MCIRDRYNPGIKTFSFYKGGNHEKSNCDSFIIRNFCIPVVQLRQGDVYKRQLLNNFINECLGLQDAGVDHNGQAFNLSLIHI